MTLPDQLRAIADRLEAAEAEKAAALDELWQIRTVDSTAVQVAAGAGVEDGGGTAIVPSAPIQQAGPPVAQAPAADLTTADSAPPGAFDPLHVVPALHTCPECGKQTPTATGLTIHRRRMHQVMPDRTAATRLADRKKVPTNGRGYSAPVGKAAIPPEPVIRHGKEAWLCSRCTQSFETRERLTAHMQKGHPPVGTEPTRPFGEQPIAEYTAGGFGD